MSLFLLSICSLFLLGCTNVKNWTFSDISNNLKSHTGIIDANAICLTTESRFLALGSTICTVDITIDSHCSIKDPWAIYTILLQNAWSLSSADYARARITQAGKIRQDWVDSALPDLQQGLVDEKYVGQTHAILDAWDGTVQVWKEEAKQKFSKWSDKFLPLPDKLIICE